MRSQPGLSRFRLVGRAQHSRVVMASTLVLLAQVACTSAAPPVVEPAPPPSPVELPPPAPDVDVDALKAEVEEAREARAQADRRNEELEEQVAALEAELTGARNRVVELEEAVATQRMELGRALEEVLRARASVRRVTSRALATSRIAEVRVQLQSAPLVDDPEIQGRLRRADGLLIRADEELAAENYGGAGYLAELANDIVRQARMAAEIRSSVDTSLTVVPVIPPRTMVILVNSNLRKGPGTEYEGLTVGKAGDEVLAVARSAAWFQIETEPGVRVWIHGDLVGESRTVDEQ